MQDRAQLGSQFKSLTPAKPYALSGQVSTRHRNKSKNKNLTLDASTASQAKNSAKDVMSDVGSILESFKHKTKTYFNPLSPPKETLVNIPEVAKTAHNRLPPYLHGVDLLAHGIGDQTRGMARHPLRMGHQSQDQKNILLASWTLDNINAAKQRQNELEGNRQMEA